MFDKNLYKLCEIYHFRRNHGLDAFGFIPCNGALVENADTTYPRAWEFLQTEAGQLLCKTEEAWQAMSTAVWHTTADKSGYNVPTPEIKFGWDGIGGVPYYVIDQEKKTIRMPDIRGMGIMTQTANQQVGDALGDRIKQIHGQWICGTGAWYNATTAPAFRELSPVGGALYASRLQAVKINSASIQQYDRYGILSLDMPSVVPVGPRNVTMRFAVNSCAFMG